MNDFDFDCEVRSRLTDALAGVITFRKFFRWFMPATWDREYTDLTGSIDMLWCEYTSGGRTREDLMERLRKALDGEYYGSRPKDGL